MYCGCQLLVGRSLTKHLHHRPYLLRENIVSSVITAVTQLSNWEMWEIASNTLGGGLDLPNPRILLYNRCMFGQKEELGFSLIPLPHYELLI